MKVLGIYGSIGFDGACKDSYIHDAGATLFIDGEHICSIQEERLSGLKYDGRFPEKSIDYVTEGLEKEDINLVMFVDIGLQEWVMSLEKNEPQKYLQRIFPNAEIGFISHHQAHAYSSIFTQSSDTGVCIIIDGGGSYNWAEGQSLGLQKCSMVLFDKRKNKFKYFPFNGEWGLLYQYWSHHIFCNKTRQEIDFMDPEHHCSFAGKIMGLAAYGSGKHLQKLYDFGVHFPEVSFDMRDPRPYPISSSDKAELLQYNFEESLTELMLRLDEDYLEGTICLTGGVFLNINANTKIVKTLKHRKFHITPFVSDCGLAFGAAAFGASLWNEVQVPENLAFLGKEYVTPKDLPTNEVYANMDGGVGGSWGNVKEEEFDLNKIAQYLEDGKIVAWYQGRSEFGPRALGNRSILMSPKYKENKDILNEKVKHREEWRPFAGVILKDHLKDYFEENIDSPYMLYSQTVKEDKRDKIPAITHVDNTCRIQTVDGGSLSLLLEEYYKISGVPVLLNTSFNDSGKPIVETPQDAIDAFLNMNIDYLVMNNTIIGK